MIDNGERTGVRWACVFASIGSAAFSCIPRQAPAPWGPAQTYPAQAYAGPPGASQPGFPARPEASPSVIRTDVWPAQWMASGPEQQPGRPAGTVDITPTPLPPPPPPPIVAPPDKPPAVVTITPAPPTATAQADRELAEHVNAFRAAHHLPLIPISSQLTIVARAHVDDLRADTGRKDECNMHSWSMGSAAFAGCCYTADHAQARCMWDKPRELSAYKHTGFEVAAWGSKLSYDDVVELWDGSQGHRTVILNLDKWSDPWGAMGCAYSDDYSVCWFGEDEDTSK